MEDKDKSQKNDKTEFIYEGTTRDLRSTTAVVNSIIYILRKILNKLKIPK